MAWPPPEPEAPEAPEAFEEGGSDSDAPLLPGRAGRPEGGPAPWSLPRILSSALGLALLLALCWRFAGPHEAASPPRRRKQVDLDTSVDFNDVAHATAKIKTWMEVGKTYGNVHGFKVFRDTLEAFHALDNNSDGQIGFSSDNLKRLKGYMSRLDIKSFKQQIKQEQQTMIAEQGPQAQMLANRYQSLQALQALQPAPAPGPARVLRRSQRRVVHELYTFGAPGTASNFLYDATREGGCMPGLRTYSTGARYTLGMGVYFEIRDPVSWITSGFNLNHAKMDSMQANDDDDKDVKNPIHECSEDPKDPAIDNFWWINGHLIYEDILRSHLDFSSATPKLWEMRTTAQGAMHLRERMNRAYLMSHFCQMNYEKDTPLISIDAPDWGWTLVGRACSQKRTFNLDSRPDGELSQVMADACKDHITLLQHNDSLQCAVVFEGSDDTLDWFANLDISLEDFCGFGHSHRGFKHKLMRMLQGVDYRQTIWPKLSSCNGLVSAGHSLGGAQAELFAACANAGLGEGEEGFEDYRYVAPMQDAAPTRLPAFFSDQAPGLFFRNRASGLCLDVQGTMSTDYESDVVLFECELPSVNWSDEQRWQMTPEGLLVNRLGGKCLTLFSGTHGSSLRQWHCNYTSNHTDQQWDLTPEQFLKSRRFGTCVDSKLQMYKCPHTDQRWSLGAGGHLRNGLSGRCLDVFGSPGTEEGAQVVLWDCEYLNNTDQRWQFTNLGALRNRLSGLCLNVVNQQGRENKPGLALSACRPEVPKADILWDLTPQGFLKDRRSGKCVDVAGLPGTERGARVQLARCEDVHVDTSGRWVLMEEGFLRNVGTGSSSQHRCLEAAGATPAERAEAGARLLVAACKVNTDQKWELTPDGFLRSVLGGRKCLGVKPPGAPAGASGLWLQNCEEPADPAQFHELKWERLQDGRLRSLQSFGCMEQSGLLLSLQPCAAASAGPGRAWGLTIEGLLKDPSGVHCASVVLPMGSPASLAHVGIRQCQQGVPDQQWDLTAEGFLRSRQLNSCLASVPQPSPQRPLALLRPCPETDQRWELAAGGLLRNQRTGQCLDAGLTQSAPGGPSWAGLATWSCDSSRASQQWELLAGG